MELRFRLKSINKKIAKLIYRFFHNFWVELTAKFIAVLIWIVCLVMMVGPEIRGSKEFDRIENALFITIVPTVLIIWLPNKWAKHQIRDELKRARADR